MGEVGPGFDLGEAATFEDGVEVGGVRCRVFAADQQPVLPADDDGADGPLPGRAARPSWSAPPRTRTCAINASGSSGHGFAVYCEWTTVGRVSGNHSSSLSSFSKVNVTANSLVASNADPDAAFVVAVTAFFVVAVVFFVVAVVFFVVLVAASAAPGIRARKAANADPLRNWRRPTSRASPTSRRGWKPGSPSLLWA